MGFAGQEPGGPRLLGLGTALLYAGTAISMNFVNKATLDAFPLAWSVMCLQMLATVLLVLPLWAMKVVDFPRLSWDKSTQLAPVSMFYALNTAFALLGLRTLNIPMYSTLKRLTPMIVLTLRAAVTRTLPSCGLTSSVVCVVAGCIVAGVGDLTFDGMGYLFALSSCFLQAIYLLLVEWRGTHQNVGSAEMLFYNAILSLPFLLLCVFLTGEYRQAAPMLAAAAHASASFPVLIVMCSVLGTLLNLSLFLCTINNSALTTTIVGVMKGVLTTVLGFFLLGGIPTSPVNILGIAMNTVGGVSYTFIKFKERASRTDSILASTKTNSLGDFPSPQQLPVVPVEHLHFTSDKGEGQVAISISMPRERTGGQLTSPAMGRKSRYI